LPFFVSSTMNSEENAELQFLRNTRLLISA
jgi:hypothetical protein